MKIFPQGEYAGKASTQASGGSRRRRERSECAGGSRLPPIETDKSVSRGDHHLTGAARARGKSKEYRDEPVKQRGMYFRVGSAGKRNEDLPARRVRRQAAGVAAGVLAQNAQAAQDCLRAPVIAQVVARLRLAAQHLTQALQRAAAATDATAIPIRDHQEVPHLRQQSDLAAKPNLRLVSRRLAVIGGGNDEVIPKAGGFRWNRFHSSLRVDSRGTIDGWSITLF